MGPASDRSGRLDGDDRTDLEDGLSENSPPGGDPTDGGVRVASRSDAGTSGRGRGIESAILIPGLLLTIAFQAVSWIALDWSGVAGLVPGILSSVIATVGGFAVAALYFRHTMVAAVVK